MLPWNSQSCRAFCNQQDWSQTRIHLFTLLCFRITQILLDWLFHRQCFTHIRIHHFHFALLAAFPVALMLLLDHTSLAKQSYFWDCCASVIFTVSPFFVTGWTDHNHGYIVFPCNTNSARLFFHRHCFTHLRKHHFYFPLLPFSFHWCFTVHFLSCNTHGDIMRILQLFSAIAFPWLFPVPQDFFFPICGTYHNTGTSFITALLRVFLRNRCIWENLLADSL